VGGGQSREEELINEARSREEEKVVEPKLEKGTEKKVPGLGTNGIKGIAGTEGDVKKERGKERGMKTWPLTGFGNCQKLKPWSNFKA